MPWCAKKIGIARRGLEIAHVAAGIAALAADIDMHRAVRRGFERVVVVSVLGVGPRDAAEAHGDIVRRLGLEEGGRERRDAELLDGGIVMQQSDLAVGQAPVRGEANGLGERRAVLRIGRRDAAIGAPVPVGIGETVVARDLPDLALGHRDVGAVPGQEPPAEMDLRGIVRCRASSRNRDACWRSQASPRDRRDCAPTRPASASSPPRSAPAGSRPARRSRCPCGRGARAVWEWTDRVARPRAETPASATLPLTIDLREMRRGFMEVREHRWPPKMHRRNERKMTG